MKSEQPRIVVIFDKLPKVISSCKTPEQLIYATRYVHLAYKTYGQSRVLRTLGQSLILGKMKQLNNAPVA